MAGTWSVFVSQTKIYLAHLFKPMVLRTTIQKQVLHHGVRNSGLSTVAAGTNTATYQNFEGPTCNYKRYPQVTGSRVTPVLHALTSTLRPQGWSGVPKLSWAYLKISVNCKRCWKPHQKNVVHSTSYDFLKVAIRL